VFFFFFVFVFPSQTAVITSIVTLSYSLPTRAGKGWQQGIFSFKSLFGCNWYNI